MQLAAATTNQGKLEEIRAVLTELTPHLEVLGLDRFPDLGPIEEPGQTFEENALHKAKAVARHTGLVSLADDSGLEVDALNGAPGVYSARFSGDGASDAANNDKLLRLLESVPPEERTARFRCVLAVFAPSGEHFLCQGSWEGRIASAPAGESGFGYDPVFIDEESGLTAAQMDRSAKNERSHRGRALQRFSALWPDFVHHLQSSER
jgi:XTP/dITP diphosphohydrolase